MMQANLVSWKRSDVLRCQLSNSAKSTLDDMECNMDVSKQPALLLILTKFIVCFESYKNTQEASQLQMVKKSKKMATCTKTLRMHFFMHDRKSIYYSLISANLHN